jgi:hypothetical protein
MALALLRPLPLYGPLWPYITFTVLCLLYGPLAPLCDMLFSYCFVK